MNIPTTLPFFDSINKQCTRRDGSPATIFSPRTQLPPFQIIRPHVADTFLESIAIIDCDGNEINIFDYFQTSPELITGGYDNGAGLFQSYDTLTENSNGKDIDSAIKTTTGAGIAAFESTDTFAVTAGDVLYCEIDLTLNSGVAPAVSIVISPGGSTISNTFTLVAGVNRIQFDITTSEASAALTFKNGSADASNFEATVTLKRTVQPAIYEFTSVDYIQYGGSPLIWNGNLVTLLKSTGGLAYDTFTLGNGQSIASGINLAGNAAGYSNNIDSAPEAGDTYQVHVNGVVINSGQAPFVNIQNSIEGVQSLSAGNNSFTFTIKTSPVGASVFQITNTSTSNFSTGQICVFKTKGDSERALSGKGLFPKGAYYLKISDGISTWYSEWFEIRDIYGNESLSLAQSAQPYDTLETTGTMIVSAIQSSGTAIAYTNAASNVVAYNESITVIFFLNQNSGQAPTLGLIDSDTNLSSNAVQASAGLNEITLTATKSLTVLRIRILVSAASDFSTSEIWVQRQYSSDFVKISFSNTNDLHGKRSDDQTILYQEGFSQSCWLKTILTTPNSNRIDVGQEKDGVFVSEKIITQYKYRIIDYINRSLFEGLIRLPQHDTITIIDEVGNSYSPRTGNVQVSADWSTFDVGSVVIEFNDGSFVWVENSTDIT